MCRPRIRIHPITRFLQQHTGTNQGLNVALAHSGVNVQLTQEAKLQAAKARRNVSAEEQQPAAAPRATP